MTTPQEIGWSAYDVYEGPFFRGTVGFESREDPSMDDKILSVITATEGGHWNAVNMYDRCILTVGLIQWCEGGQFSVSDMLGLAAETDPGLLAPLEGVMKDSRVTFRQNARGKWRFFFDDGRGEVDSTLKQKALFLKDSDGTKGSWSGESRERAKDWAAGFATLYSNTRAIYTQRQYTIPRLYQFALPFSRAWIEQAKRRACPVGDAFICGFLSFAANNPSRADKALQNAVSAWKDAPFTLEWLKSVLEHLTFDSGVTIYPHRYDAIRPVLERTFGIDLPDYASSLQGLLSPTEIQAILVHKLGYNLGTSGAGGDGVDGRWGPKSSSALADFERRNNLNADGLPDFATNAALLKARDAA